MQEYHMAFTSDELMIFRSLSRDYKKSVRQGQQAAADSLKRAYIVWFANFPIPRELDMDEEEHLWLMERKKKVRNYLIQRW